MTTEKYLYLEMEIGRFKDIGTFLMLPEPLKMSYYF